MKKDAKNEDFSNHFKKFMDSFSPNERSELLEQMMHHYFEGAMNLQNNALQAMAELNKMHQDFLRDAFLSISLKTAENSPVEKDRAIAASIKKFIEDAMEQNQKVWGGYMRYLLRFNKSSPKKRSSNGEGVFSDSAKKNWSDIYKDSYKMWSKYCLRKS